MEATKQRRRFTVDDYYRMGDAGILRPEDRVELIDGEIVEMPPIGSPHAWSVDALTGLLVPAVGDRAIVRVQGPLRIDQYSEPEPDLSLLMPGPGRYHRTHPAPGDVLLVVEVADTTATYDRTVKLELYAKSGIPEYWIVDLRREVVEVYTGPRGDTFAGAREAGSGTEISPGAFPDVVLDAGVILTP